MNTKVIIFDKDGTLMDFDSFWVTVTCNMIEELKCETGMLDVPTDEILAVLGVEDGVTGIKGSLCCGTYKQMGEEIHDVLKRYGCQSAIDEVTRLMIQGYHKNYDKAIIKPTCDNICEVLAGLKSCGIRLVVVTTDEPLGTQKCLQRLGIDGYIDRVYTDDGYFRTKPDPHCIFDILEKECVDKSEVVMVGDTLTDITFARNGGIKAIGVAKNEKNREILAGQTDKVMPDISYIFEVLE